MDFTPYSTDPGLPVPSISSLGIFVTRPPRTASRKSATSKAGYPVDVADVTLGDCARRDDVAPEADDVEILLAEGVQAGPCGPA
ncbi:hypothetical protein Psi02_10080 [Planotetraspora silvatica]|uniref:Uncharacterized protein n=1 Tax=Planotetraspora silvatica TaxID=234614 RepID=A0A8J3XKK9_9ACTN|nr:hypothetical protein Psi02_10080 [Planotetraspora silvatica]